VRHVRCIGINPWEYGNDHPGAVDERRWLLNLTGGRFELKEATLYTAFRRLEDAGCIVSYWGDETTGARRRYYSITDLGKESYRLRKKEWETAEAVIDKLLAEGEKGGSK